MILLRVIHTIKTAFFNLVGACFGLALLIGCFLLAVAGGTLLGLLIARIAYTVFKTVIF